MPRAGWRSPLPVRRVERSSHADAPTDRWPYTLPAVRQVLDIGLELTAATVLTGENGTGKSTLVEGIAMAYGLSAEGGSTGARHSTRPTESPLSEQLFLLRGTGASRWGYFLRGETMHGLFTYLESSGAADRGFHSLSHGESFLAMLDTKRFEGEGFFVLDEPEAGLSFRAQLAVLATLGDILGSPGTQVLLATHSPVIAALPGATILQLDEEGIHQATWHDLDVVDHYRRFLDGPARYLRHLT